VNSTFARIDFSAIPLKNILFMKNAFLEVLGETGEAKENETSPTVFGFGFKTR
jgi:hypothetical protein